MSRELKGDGFDDIDDDDGLQIAPLAGFQSKPNGNLKHNCPRASSSVDSTCMSVEHHVHDQSSPPSSGVNESPVDAEYHSTLPVCVVKVISTSGPISSTHPFLKANTWYRFHHTADAEKFVERYLNTHIPIFNRRGSLPKRSAIPKPIIRLLERDASLESVEHLLRLATVAANNWSQVEERLATAAQMVSVRKVLLALKIEKGPLSPGVETLEPHELYDEPNWMFESVGDAVLYLHRYAATNEWDWREISNDTQVNGRHKKALLKVLQAPLEVVEALYIGVDAIHSRIANWSRLQPHTERLREALETMMKDKRPLLPEYPSLDANTTYRPQTLREAITFLVEYINTGRGIVLLVQERDHNCPQLAALRILLRDGSEQDLSDLISVVESFITMSSPMHVKEIYDYLLQIQLSRIHSHPDGSVCGRTLPINFIEGDIYIDDNLKIFRISPDWGFNGLDHHRVFYYEDEDKLQITCLSDDERDLLYWMLPTEVTDRLEESVQMSFERLLNKWKNICDQDLPHLHYFNNSRNTINERHFIVLSPPAYDKSTSINDVSKLGFLQTLSRLLGSLKACHKSYGTTLDQYDRELIRLMALRNGKLSGMRQDHSKFWLELSSSPELLAICDSLESENRQMLMEALQEALDMKSFRTPEEYKIIFRLLRRFTKGYKTLPESLVIRGRITEISQYPVGVGGNADVFRGFHNGRHVALKKFRVTVSTLQDDLFQNIAREALVWRQLNHENVLPFIGYYQEFGYCLVSLWMPEGNLAAYVKANPACNRWQLCLDVTHGLEYLHEMAGLVHGDLRADNILVEKKEDDTVHARICDFGLSTILEATLQENLHRVSVPRGSIGATRWLAPEYLTGNTSKHMPGDVYAWACVCLEVFSGECPFEELKMDSQVIIAISKDDQPTKPKSIEQTLIEHRLHSSLVWELMVSCWSADPQNRPTMAVVLDQFSNSRMRFS